MAGHPVRWAVQRHPPADDRQPHLRRLRADCAKHEVTGQPDDQYHEADQLQRADIREQPYEDQEHPEHRERYPHPGDQHVHGSPFRSRRPRSDHDEQCDYPLGGHLVPSTTEPVYSTAPGSVTRAFSASRAQSGPVP
ncbi:MAG: hypothetical protein ACRDTA_16650 [Pseudonocardiaceae bacterium]